LFKDKFYDNKEVNRHPLEDLSRISFKSFHGIITMITDFIISENDENAGCYKLISIENEFGDLVNFVVSPTTYFVDHAMVNEGDKVTGYYNANAPVPLIFPPQYRALIIAKDTPHQNVKVDYFNSDLISNDDMLKLNISQYTQILLRNNQTFSRNFTNRNLIVLYGPSTRSIPAQTTPYKIIVWC
jgi:hypothetical protein